MNHRIYIAVIACVALIGGVIANQLSSNGLLNQSNIESKLKYLATYPQPRALTNFNLNDQNNQSFTNEDLKNRWTLAFLGYTYCPDVCPITLASLSQAYEQLQNLPTDEPLQIVFISVDPKRDTAERLQDYMSYFNQEFVGVTGSHSELYPLVRSMGMMYAMAGDPEESDYLVDHSASIAVINPDAHVIGRFKPTLIDSEVATSDIALIIDDMPFVVNNHKLRGE